MKVKTLKDAIGIILSQPPELHYPAYYADLLSEADVTGKNVRKCSEIPNSSDLNKFIDGLEEIFADIRERHDDDSVCGLCEYNGAYIGQSGDWCNECPGFDRDDCFKLSDECRKRWINTITNSLPSVHPEKRTEERAETHACDSIDRQAAIDAIHCDITIKGKQNAEVVAETIASFVDRIKGLPSAQPEIILCKDCKHWTQSMGKMKGYGLGRCDFHDADLVACNGFCYWAERRADG